MGSLVRSASSGGRLATDLATGNSCACAQKRSVRVTGRLGATGLDLGLRKEPVLPRRRMEKRRNDQAARAISIGQLNALRRLHLRPIDVVVFDGPSGGLRPGKPVLEVRFPLRCFQRLSNPHTATQRCHWRDNWYTGGASNPVLSY